MKTLTIATLTFFFCSSISQEQTYTGKVTAVKNGDTIEVLKDGRKFSVSIEVRLQGVDAPELRQPYGPESLRALYTMVYNKSVKVITRTQGKYGKTTADIFLEDPSTPGQYPVWVNKLLLSNGHAWYYDKHSGQQPELLEAEASARKDSLGLWASKNPIPPWQWYQRDH